MRKWWSILLMLLLIKQGFSQDTCLPKYALPVKNIRLQQQVDLAYIEQGKGRSIIFIHGLGGNLSHWQKSVQALSDKFCCIAIDLPGYGHSGKTFTTGGKDQLQFYADVITEFIKQKKLKKVTLAGHSMGGQIATIVALQQPRLVSKLILAAPAGLETFTGKEATLLINATPPSTFENQNEAVIRNNFKLNFYEQPADAEALIQDRLRLKTCSDFKQYTEAVSNGVKGMLAHPVKNELPAIKQPVLIIFGENDALIPNRLLHPSLTRETLIKEAESSIKNLKTVIVPKTGHFLQFEKNTEVNNAIKDFNQ